MLKWTLSNIRTKWLDYFKNQGHQIWPSQSLVPHNDPSLLLINSGVATLKPFFSGIKNPPSYRLTSSQKCIRTNDIENIGVTSRHHSFFEMLGNFSIGDYFKKEAIHFAYDILVNHFCLDVNKLYFTVYKDDTDAYNEWIKLGINKHKILKCDKDRNFWDVGNGPCGPCTEIYFDRGKKYDPKNIGEELFFKDIENDRYVEIWNIVFSQFNNDGKDNYTELARKNIDTGAGLERLACVLQDVPTDYDTDAFISLIKILENHTNFKYEINAYFTNDRNQKQINRNFIIICDHIKASVFAIADKIFPSAKDRGAVIRRLIRRALMYANFLNLNKNFIKDLINAIVDSMSDFYPYLLKNKDEIIKTIYTESDLFEQTLQKGFLLLKNAISKNKKLSAIDVFKLTDTYGLPYEFIKIMCEQNNINFDEKQYIKLMKEHQKISKNTNNIKAFIEQNNELLTFKKNSLFDYDSLTLLDSKIIGIFDENFHQVNKIKNKCWLVFDKTPFYATSGGQAHDEGFIIVDNKQTKVLDVIKGPNLQHFHLIDPDFEINTNSIVNQLRVDADKRLRISRNHSCEHLLEKTLQSLVDKSIYQEGSSKSYLKYSFDFHCKHKLSDEEIYLVEDKINEIINSNASVSTKIMSLAEAKEIHAQANFEKTYEKIGDKLRVVIIDQNVATICGGTHIKNSRDIEQFMIIDYELKGSNFYRIVGITSNDTITNYLSNEIDKLKLQINNMKNELDHHKIISDEFNKIFNSLNYDADRICFRKLKLDFKKIKEVYTSLIKQSIKDINKNHTTELAKKFIPLSAGCIHYTFVKDEDTKLLSSVLLNLCNQNPSHVFIFFNEKKDKLEYVIASGKEIIINLWLANSLVQQFNKLLNGYGGGSKYLAQGGAVLSDFVYTKSLLIDLLKTLTK